MKLLITGDFCPRDRIASLFEQGQYELVLKEVAQCVRKFDYAITNLEAPIIQGGENPINKCGPNLKCSNSTIDALKYAGFSCVTLANNHFRDFGDEGCLNTFKRLKEAHIEYVGAGKNINDAQKVLYFEQEFVKISIVNICENEFSIADESHAGSAPLNLIDVYNQIKTAKENSNFIIVIIHGGHEGYQLPSLRMKKLYRWFVEIGANVIINHHQHCFSGYEVYNGAPIFYGIGNFCFDKKGKRDCIWNEGYMVALEINYDKQRISFDYKIIPYIQANHNPNVEIIYGDRKREFLNQINSINSIISDDKRLAFSFNEFVQKNIKYKKSFITPYTNKYLAFLYKHNLLPSFVGNYRRLGILNNIICESHRDIFIQCIKSK